MEANGNVVHAGSRQSWRPTSPVFREYALTLCRKLARTVQGQPLRDRLAHGQRIRLEQRGGLFRRRRTRVPTLVRGALRHAGGGERGVGRPRSGRRRSAASTRATCPATWAPIRWSTPPSSWTTRVSVRTHSRSSTERSETAIEEICPDKPYTTNFMVSTDQCTLDYADGPPRSISCPTTTISCPENPIWTSWPALIRWSAGSPATTPWYLMEHSTSAVQWKPVNTRKRNGEMVRDALPMWRWARTPSTSSVASVALRRGGVPLRHGAARGPG